MITVNDQEVRVVFSYTTQMKGRIKPKPVEVTRAEAYKGAYLVATGHAFQHPLDAPNRKVGRTLAFKRLLTNLRLYDVLPKEIRAELANQYFGRNSGKAKESSSNPTL